MSVTIVRRSILLISAVALLLIAVFVASRLWSDLSGAGNTRGRSGAGGAIPVETVTVRRGAIEDRLRIAGTLMAAEEFAVAAEVSARLLELHVDIGDTVKRGALIARLESDDFEQAVREAAAAVQIAEAELLKAKSQVDIKERSAARYQQLLKRGIATEAEADEAEAERLTAVTAIAVAEARLVQAKAAHASAQLALADTVIKAEWQGDDIERVIGERWVDTGEQLQRGQNICSVLKINPLKGVVYVTERHYAGIKPGQDVYISVDAFPGQEVKATVSRVAPQFNSDSRQAKIELLIPNADLHLKPGMFMRAELVNKRAEDVLLIPEESLISRAGAPAIFIVADGEKAKQVAVKVLIRDQDLIAVEALDGTALDNAQVITLGQHLLTDDSPIRMANE